ncbi:MAG: hypothetical protein AMJ79_01820 [Phycisphaerae bacterium SM23_30]|nr:MAG: hypothetical protein AMJ79_01820 [Phycisphaerae bacterium SM23_30]
MNGGCAVLQPTASIKTTDEIPAVAREFRAAWVATAANIDWPSKPGLTTAEQKRQALEILDAAGELHLNAIVFQVRPQCDALYASEIEPWSFYLTGQQGKAPEPYYDPLEFWIEQAHNRGMELHAWFNPYRAHHPSGGKVTDTSAVRRHPEIVKALQGGYYWLDPALKETQDYSIDVVMDVVRRYDVDGIHFDDYFYPYRDYNGGRDFPDDDTWRDYKDKGGKLPRNDWRRDAVNRFIRRLYQAIKKEKRHVKFGLSPFGIWRPGYPESIQGLDQYDVLYADAKLWFNKGWVDYWTPQLYWPVNQIPQSFPVLLGWWAQENKKNRNFWPGINTGRGINEYGADENINQIMIIRGFLPESPGHVHFSMKTLLRNRHGVSDALKAGPYKEQALVPPSPWLDNKPPAPPQVEIKVQDDELAISLGHDNEAEVFRWVVYTKQGGRWRYEILNRHDHTYTAAKQQVTRIAVSAVDRTGNESSRTLVALDATIDDN